MTTNDLIAMMAYEILCTINANDKGKGTFFPVLKLHDDMCFNERNHPNGLCAPFNEAIRRMVVKELIWREYVRDGNKSHPVYGLYEAGHEALHNHKDCKVYV